MLAYDRGDEASLSKDRYVVLLAESLTLVGGRKVENAGSRCITGGETASNDWFPRPMDRGEGEDKAEENALVPLRVCKPGYGLSSAMLNGESARDDGGDSNSRPCS